MLTKQNTLHTMMTMTISGRQSFCCKTLNVLTWYYNPWYMKIFFFSLHPIRKELIARLDQAEKESLDAAHLAKEYADLAEENRTLKLAQTQCVEQLEKLRTQYQKRQGSS